MGNYKKKSVLVASKKELQKVWCKNNQIADPDALTGDTSYGTLCST